MHPECRVRVGHVRSADLLDSGKPVRFCKGEIGESQDAAAARLAMRGGAFKAAIHRLRRRFRELVRAEVAGACMLLRIPMTRCGTWWRRWRGGGEDALAD